MESTLKDKARKLRINMTLAERRLWGYIRSKQLGFKFRRQFIIGSKYIVDFICLEKKLIIEIDGGSHNMKKSRDNIRDNYLIKQGFKVIHLTNDEICNDLEESINKIKKNLKLD